MEKTQSLYFYSSRLINILLLAVGLSFIVLGFLLGVVGFQAKIIPLSGIGIFIALLFIILMIPTLKKVLNPKPYIIITEESLTINQPFRGSIPIDWEDIKGFEIMTAQLNKLIFIILDDNDKYRKRMSKRTKFLNKPHNMVGLSPIWIIWRQVKRTDRDKLVRELDRLSNSDPAFYKSLSSQLNNEKKEQKSNRKIDTKYLFKAYGYSFIITVGAFSLSRIGDDGNYTPGLVLSFILHPFAKIIFDVIIGFKISFIVRKERYMYIFIMQLMISVYVLLYLFSLFIAPFGILYVILKSLYRIYKKSMKYK